MSRRVQFVLLCEDKQHRAFLRRFLERMRPNDHVLRIEMAPRGSGSAEQFVRMQFLTELVDHRRRHVSQALLVMVDGDNRGVARRRAGLDDACRENGLAIGELREGVLVFIPTWRIETWLAYLDGATVDETKPDYPRLPRARECAPHVDTLVEMCQRNQLREPAPTSLVAACTEYRRWAATI